MTALGKRDRVQINVRVDRHDRDALNELAPLDERTANGVIRHLIKAWIAEKQQEAT